MAKEKQSLFYGLILSPNMEMTVEGYLICKNVPICRSGYQDYRGRELVGFPGYQESWGLDPDKLYSVLRPKDEVIDPDTIASFEGKTVTDTHPRAAGNVVTIDNDNEYNCGHGQDVRRGPDTPDGNVTLECNLVIKNPELVEKIRPSGDPEGGIREISCGYTLHLRRLADGTIAMFKIRGNHIAVVEDGRAGDRIAILDSAPPDVKPKEGSTMSLLDKVLGRGVKATLADASDEELAGFGRTILAIDSKEEKKDEPAKDDGKDGHHAKDDGKEKEMSHACDDDSHKLAHDALDRFLHAGADDNLENLRTEVNKFLKEEEKEPQHAKDADEKKESLEELEKKEAKDESMDDDAKDDDAAKDDDEEVAADGTEPERIDNKGKSVLNAANDSVRAHVKAIRPIVAGFLSIPRAERTVGQQVAIDSFNTMVKSFNKAGGNAYKALTVTKIPDKIPSLIAVDSKTVAKSCTCFDGVPYRKGLDRHQATCLKEGTK